MEGIIIVTGLIAIMMARAIFSSPSRVTPY